MPLINLVVVLLVVGVLLWLVNTYIPMDRKIKNILNIVVVDEGVAKNLSTSSLKDDAYAFIFSQQGLMAGVSIEGTKISKINR